MKEKEEILSTLLFWDKLNKAEKEELISYSDYKCFDQGSFIYSHDEACLGMVIVIKGEVRLAMLSEEGKEVTLYTLNEGDVEVLSASCVVNQITFETQIQAKEDTCLLILPAAILSKYKENNIYVRSYIYEILAERFSDVMWTLEQILFYKIDTRLANYLLKLALNNKDNVITITQEEIAKEINSAREVVTRMLKRFEKEGLIAVRRGSIEILSVEGLKKIG